MKSEPHFTFVDSEESMVEFFEKNKSVEWMCFDTEFIGEKRFKTLLCLTQVATVHGIYLIDNIKLENVDLFLEMIANPAILKITHAGENDYRVLYNHYKVLPKNIFDVQVAAGFVGHGYPISFRRLVELELNKRLNKGATVSDWESRPINKRQIRYAIDDVIYLKDIYDNLNANLVKNNRKLWADAEFQKLEHPEYFQVDKYRKLEGSKLFRELDAKEKIFYIRLLGWRDKVAEEKNYSREMILSDKYLPHIVKNIASGKNALLNNRRLNKNIVERRYETFKNLFDKPANQEENEIVASIKPAPHKLDPEVENLFDLLYIMVKMKCQQNNISPELVLHRSVLKKMKFDFEYFDDRLENTWRKDLLGVDLVDWLKRRDQLSISLENGVCEIKMP